MEAINTDSMLGTWHGSDPTYFVHVLNCAAVGSAFMVQQSDAGVDSAANNLKTEMIVR